MGDAPWRVLVPVAVLEGESVPEPVADLLSTLPVVLLGYHELPEQTPPGQARLQFEEQAQSKLEDVAAAFGTDRTDLETRLVFTHDGEQTVERVAEETDCEAVLVSNPSGPADRVLVAVGSEVDPNRLSSFVAALVGERAIAVSLLDADADGQTVPAGESLIDEVRSLLQGFGVETTVLDPTEFEGSSLDMIATAAADHDAVVMGERNETLGTVVFGDPAEQVADRSVGPVLVVRRPIEQTG